MKFKKIVAVATAVAAMTSMLGMTAFAAEWNTDGGTLDVEGDSYVVAPTIEVELPGDLTFGINPMKLDVGDGETPNKAQIISGDYLVVNYSDVAVAVSASTKVTAGTDVQLMDTSAMVATAWDDDTKELKAVDSKKAIWLVQLYPTDISNEGVMTMPAINEGTSVAADVDGDTLTTSAPATPVVFVLSAWDEANAANSMGGFQFGGAVDPNAAFAEGDVKVTTTFTLNVITEAQKTNNYDTYETNGSKSLSSAFETIKKAK